jgi:hypothetical protein
MKCCKHSHSDRLAHSVFDFGVIFGPSKMTAKRVQNRVHAGAKIAWRVGYEGARGKR